MWNVITEYDKNCPNTDRLVVGFFIEGAEPYAMLCYYDSKKGYWYNDELGILNAPDYWEETPENEEKNERLDRK